MVDADVLLIDEALAVGDVFFRQKCYQRLETLRQRGVTIVLASHAMPDVEQFCTRTALIDAGELRFLGDSVEAVRRYYLLQRSHEGLSARSSPGVADWPVLEAPADAAPQPAPEAFLDLSAVPQVTTGLARCRRVALCDAQGNPCSVFQQGQTARFYYEFELFQDIETPIGGVVITNDRNVTVHGKSTLEYGTPVPSSAPAGTVVRFWQDIELQVAAGEYTFEIGFSDLPRSDYERKHLYPHAELDAHINRLCLVPNVGQFAVVFRTQGAPVQLLHHGLCNLPGTCRVAVVPAQPPAAVAT
jgi:energy-coupling factor transporter ATP-binding protein EcfA2